MTGRIAVVGAGMAGVRFAERYAALGGRAEATVYGAEPCAPYNRVLLADVLARPVRRVGHRPARPVRRCCAPEPR
ncbi:hypothetical protein GCM10020000_00710 [Streptomyces olivoverticillatus]